MLDSFRTAPPSRQLLLIGLVVALVCALLATVYFVWFRTSYEVLYRGLRDADAATIVAELDRTHVDYRLDDGGHTILVPTGQVDGTRLHVAGQDLPLQGTVGFELFNNSSIGLTEFAQRINLQRALQGELARTIMTIDGVESARVHLSLGERTVFRGDRQPPRASVAIRTLPGRRLNPTTIRGIQRLVAGSVPDLDFASVAVLNDRGAVVSGDAPDDIGASAGSAEERSVERFFETRIRRALEARFPPDAIEVSVWAAVGSGTATEQAAAAVPADPQAPMTGRGFRLRVEAAIASPLAGDARDQVARIVEDAIGYDAGLGDAVTVTASAPIPAAADWNDSPSQAPAAVAPPPPAASAAAPSGYFWTPIALVILLAGLFLLLRRRAAAGPRPMNEQERLRAVAQLRTLLQQRETDAAPQA